MNYELAKELKDGGYPQKSGLVWYFLEKKHCKNNQTGDWYTREAEWKQFHHRNPKTLNIEWYYCPSLEELIEVCGKDFASLDRWGSFSKFTTVDKEWCAFGIEKRISGGGKTPTEAVARLWLELNKVIHTQ